MTPEQRKRAKDINADIGRRIRQARILAGLSMTQLAISLGVSFQQIQKYENSSNRASGAALVLISERLGCQITDLLPEQGDKLAGIDQHGGRERAVIAAVNDLKKLDRVTYKAFCALLRATVEGQRESHEGP